MKKIFSARSPFWQIAIFGVFFVGAELMLYSEKHGYSELGRWSNMLTASIVLILGICYVSLFSSYNRKNPEHKIKYFGLLPPEFKEEDEGMAAITAKATRNVYIFHSFVLPGFALIFAYTTPEAMITLLGFAILVLGHYIIYWVTIWPAWAELDSDN